MSGRRKLPIAVVEADAALIPPPPMPEETEAEKAAQAETIRRLRELADLLQQRNLDLAVALAQQAARGRGPLVDHFAELGRRFGPSLKAHEKTTRFQVIEGGNVAPKDGWR
jgi:hypothetical protein